MIEEPYRWLEAISNRREYVAEQLKGGSPVLAASLPDGILLAGIGSGNSKVFELFDRHALAALGHPADIERIRQAAIDTAHLEAFHRAPDDVSLRRLIGFALGPQLKTAFEQIFSAPFLIELILAEVDPNGSKDVLIRLHFDGSYEFLAKGIAVAAGNPEREAAATHWLAENSGDRSDRRRVADLLLQTWWCLKENKTFDDALPPEPERQEGWRAATAEKTVEIGWLARQARRPAHYQALTLPEIGL